MAKSLKKQAAARAKPTPHPLKASPSPSSPTPSPSSFFYTQIVPALIVLGTAAVLAGVLHIHAALESTQAELLASQLEVTEAKARELESTEVLFAARKVATTIAKSKEQLINEQMTRFSDELAKVGNVYHATLQKLAGANKLLKDKSAALQKAQTMLHDQSKSAEAYVVELKNQIVTKGKSIATLTEKLHVMVTRAAAREAYRCTPNATIAVLANVRLSDGKVDSTGYTKRLCQTECDWNRACASFGFEDSVGFCQLWSTDGPPTPSTLGASLCITETGRAGGGSGRKGSSSTRSSSGGGVGNTGSNDNKEYVCHADTTYRGDPARRANFFKVHRAVVSPLLKRPISREQCEAKCSSTPKCESYNFSVKHYKAPTGYCTLYSKAFGASQMPRESETMQIWANVNWYCRKASTFASAGESEVALF